MMALDVSEIWEPPFECLEVLKQIIIIFKMASNQIEPIEATDNGFD